jgi:hypothetical protein
MIATLATSQNFQKKPKKGHWREAGETACQVLMWKAALKINLCRTSFPNKISVMK